MKVELRSGRRVAGEVSLDGADPVRDLAFFWLSLAEQDITVTSLKLVDDEEGTSNGKH